MASVAFETALLLVLVYVPWMNQTFQLRPMHYIAFLAPLPFSFFMLLIDELRKLCIRKFGEQHNIVAYVTYY